MGETFNDTAKVAGWQLEGQLITASPSVSTLSVT